MATPLFLAKYPLKHTFMYFGPFVKMNYRNFNPSTLELGMSECITTTRRPGYLEWATGLREPGYHPQPVFGASW